MLMARDALEDGFSRWTGWLEHWFPNMCVGWVVRTDGAPEGAIWSVLLRHGRYAWIHVTREALTLNERDFNRVTGSLERSDWYAELDAAVRIRIDEGGGLSRLDDHQRWYARPPGSGSTLAQQR